MKLYYIAGLFILTVVLVYIMKRLKTYKNPMLVEIEDVLLARDQLIKHGRELAIRHVVDKKVNVKRFLLNKLDNSFREIEKIYKKLNQEANRGKDLPKASEWLLDNFYIIEIQYKGIRSGLKQQKKIVLNGLQDGGVKGYPRVYSLALELVCHTEGVVTEDDIINFIKSYQREKTLSIKEVSSLCDMISIALLEYTLDICQKIYRTKELWNKVDNIDLSSVLYLDGNFSNQLYMDNTFLQRMYTILRKDGEVGKIAILDKKLNYLGTNIKEVIENEHNYQAIIRLKIGNCITSLKNISNLNWENIFESLCVVELILKRDPLNVYENMDSETKNYYRYHVEKLAKELKTKETAVAKVALELAVASHGNGNKKKESHVGYYIIDKGREKIFANFNQKHNRTSIYLKSEKPYTTLIILLTIIILFIFTRYAFVNSRNIKVAVLVGLVILNPVLSISTLVINKILLSIIQPSILPKLDLSEGIPDDSKTFVVIPTLLANEKRVEELALQLEIHYLSNKEKNLYFALIGDFKDGDSEYTEIDEKITNKGLKAIRVLNEKYSTDEELFFFLHRHRTYSPSEKKWMGWERKRGALIEFNNFLLGEKETNFSTISSDINHLIGKIKYIITLDADTKLPLETGRELIGTISHPLNEAIVDEKLGIVTEGYGIIQPRIVVDIESSNKSLFSRIYAGQGGIDPYTTAVSDIYQDLFGEGIFTGKGIYNLQVFQRCLINSIPDNTVLSHDLLEGSYTRTGLATDIELVDGYPEKYISYMMRLHRWVRGDWQLIRWLKLGKDNPISPLSKWKIFDNLRRSAVSIWVLIVIILGMTIFPGNKYIWIALAVTVILTPSILTFFEYLLIGTSVKTRFKSNGNLIQGEKASLYQGLLTLVFLPYEGYLMEDAICRTLYRVYYSKTNLLEWTTAFDMEKRLKNDLNSYFIKMKSGPLIGGLLILIVFLVAPQNILVALFFGIMWLISPLIAYIISKNDIEKQKIDVEHIHRIGRKTWDYYENITNEENNYLPPDNFQEYPYNGLANRTSPTNIGFLLLSILSARDLGYITTSKMVELLGNTISTIEKLEKWDGHLYNWYNTNNLKPLRPYFVSTVDSGNFISYLYTLKEGLLEYIDKPLIDDVLFRGIINTIKLYEDENDILDNSIIIKQESFSKYDELKFLCNQLNRKKNNGMENPWFDKSIVMINNLIREYDKYLLDDDLTNIKENSIEKFNQNFSLYELKLYYTNVLENTEDKKIKDEMGILLQNVNELIIDIENLIKKIGEVINNTKFASLYDKEKELFTIGYFVEDNELVNSYYDLLASEARIASYIAICQGVVPKKHWYKLDRSLVLWKGYRCLASWTGTMFEYLMPMLIMKDYKNTLLDESYKTAIKAQIDYCKDNRMPWGISESGFFAFDINLNYQYKAFGIPQLGFKRGLKEDLVISPYASMLALDLFPEEVKINMEQLTREYVEGMYGFYEAVDYTVKRLPVNMEKAIVKSYMSHHQGMIFLSINNYINDNILVKRFHNNPEIKCGELLLQEKIPLNLIVTKENENTLELKYVENIKKELILRRFGKGSIEDVKYHLLSSGNYTLFISSRGTGYSKMGKYHLYRWRKDSQIRPYGYFIYIKDLNKNKLWSTTYEPTKVYPEKYEVKYTDYKASFYRKDGDIESEMDIVLFPEENGEIRKVTLLNNGSEDTLLELSSFVEITIDSYEADLAHTVFNNLFIKTELFDDGVLLGNRRNIDKKKGSPWLVHCLVSDELGEGSYQYETSRTNFLGRGTDLSNPQGVNRELTNTVGAVLDPIMSLRKRIKLKSGESKTIYYIIGIFDKKDIAIEFAKKYREISTIERALELSLIRSQTEISYLNYSKEDIKLFNELLPNVLFSNGENKRKYKDIINVNIRGQEGLWAYGISGDNPLILLRIKSIEGLDTLKTILRAHSFWNQKGLIVDLLILNEDYGSYYEPLYEKIKHIIYETNSYQPSGRGNTFIVKANEIDDEGKALLFKWADMIITAEEGIERGNTIPKIASFKKFNKPIKTFKNIKTKMELNFFNGIGGFSLDGKEYSIILSKGIYTPLPWINVIANKNFGFIISEKGTGFTWAHNSRENKLTPWYNDPILDMPSEIIYLRDDETGEAWTIAPAPIREDEDYIITHGKGYTVFNHNSHGIEQSTTMYVSLSENIKINRIILKNVSNIDRKLSVVYYLRPVLGVSDELTAKHLETFMDKEEVIFSIKNSANTEFRNSTIYITSSEKINSYTGDRYEFLGPLGDLANPNGLKLEKFSNRTGIGYDPCCALEINMDISKGESKEILLLIGESTNDESGYKMIKEYRQLSNAKNELDNVIEYWKDKLSNIKIETPDEPMNILMNSWLIYQTIVARLWARAAFYQVGGAYGARDQIQDAMNSIYFFPEECKSQILNLCRHQFIEGDVQHWWHPNPFDEVNKGIRSRYSDDLLWLPYVVSEYINITGDYELLTEETPFIDSEVLREEENDRYEVPKVSNNIGSVYDHCTRAIDRALDFGERGLPLMRSGDWNDGMNHVGYKGLGESIWLGWFLGDILNRFIPLCEVQKDYIRKERYTNIIAQLKNSLNTNGWDGEWYKRAYFDDGTPLGSKENDECRIDSISQSWGVLSNLADNDKKKKAMESLERYLVKEDEGMILLLTPPFEDGILEPGYIKSYVPGVRENGGQYTHAAAWAIGAFALMGNGDKAIKYFHMINPINHTRTFLECSKYRAEPYVLSADVYSVEPHTGRGGWTWYTGSAGWYYKIGLEFILGFKKINDRLYFDPCIPSSWDCYSIEYRYLETTYNIVVKNPYKISNGIYHITMDGKLINDKYVPLLDDRITHNVEIIMGNNKLVLN